MRSTIKSSNSDLDPGLCVLEYGAIGVGKTDSLLSLPDPLLLISTEPKDIKRTIKEHMRRNNESERHIEVRDFDNFNEHMDHLNSLISQFKEGKKPFRSIGFDTLSFVQ